MFKYFICLIISCAFSFPIFAAEETKNKDSQNNSVQDSGAFEVERHEINGYEVFLIDNRYGNEVTLGTTVPTGAWHDNPVTHAGRAHLFEHVIHFGSQKFPNDNTLDLASRLGASVNAGTYNERTVYHLTFHPDLFKQAAELQGSMMTQRLWSEEAFAKEKRNVMDEALKYQSHSARILDSAIMIGLLPEGHPWKMYDVGSQAQLTAMTLEDLKQLYYSNYIPGSMRIFVIGNFSNPVDGQIPVDKKAVLEAIKANYLAVEVPAEYKKITPSKYIPFPQYAAADKNARFIEVASPKKDEYALQLQFQITQRFAQSNPATIETMNDYLNIRGEGSLFNYLQSLGWITRLSFYAQSLNNVTVESVLIDLTAEGAKNRQAVITAILAYIHDLEKTGVPEDFLAYLKKRNILSYSGNMHYTEHTLATADSMLKHYFNYKDALNFSKNYNAVTADLFNRALSNAFNVDTMMGGYIGDDVHSQEKLPVFDAAINILRDESLFKQWTDARQKGIEGRAPIATQLKPVEMPIEFSTKPQPGAAKAARFVEQSDYGVTVALEEDHAQAEGAITLHYDFGLFPNAASAAAEALLARAFRKHYEQQLDYLSSMQLLGELTVPGFFVTDGNSLAATQTMKWLIEAVFSFAPSDKELNYAKDSLLQETLDADDQFPANTTVQALRVKGSKGSFHLKEINEIAQKLSREQVIDLVQKRRGQADIYVSMLGDFSGADASAVASFAQQFVGGKLTPDERRESRDRIKPITEYSRHLWPLGDNQTMQSFGVARVYAGPKVGSKDEAALMILDRELYPRVFDLNRTQRGLGYVHAASFRSTPQGHTHFTFYGQADGKEDAKSEENLALTKQGWSELLAKVKSRDLSADGFAGLIAAELRSRKIIPYKLADRADRAMFSMRAMGHLNGHSDLTARLAALTADDIYTAGQKYLLNQPYTELIATRRTDCGSFLMAEFEGGIAPTEVKATK